MLLLRAFLLLQLLQRWNASKKCLAICWKFLVVGRILIEQRFWSVPTAPSSPNCFAYVWNLQLLLVFCMFDTNVHINSTAAVFSTVFVFSMRSEAWLHLYCA